jgi:IS30 family transposase
MARKYVQLSLEDRCEIAKRHAEGHSIRKIAAALDRAPSSISREIRRNSGAKVGYKPAYADQQTAARRWTGSKLARNGALRTSVLKALAEGWSPEQVAGRLEHENGKPVLSHETIYRFIYGELVRTKNYDWRLYLPRAKSKRGYRGRKGGSPASFIQQRRAISERPDEAADRASTGHWEADLIAFSAYGQSILAVHERQSRLLLAERIESKHADGVADILTTMLAGVPARMRRSITFDNGTEFARHHRLHAIDCQTFFCDPHAPWQKGGVENAIGRMRRLLPRRTNLDTLPEGRLQAFVRAYNATPRKCLDYQTPAEVFLAHLLHFKCESISRPTAG